MSASTDRENNKVEVAVGPLKARKHEQPIGRYERPLRNGDCSYDKQCNVAAAHISVTRYVASVTRFTE